MTPLQTKEETVARNPLFINHFDFGWVRNLNGKVGLPFGSMQDVKNAEFDGAEILLTRNVRKQFEDFVSDARFHGLDVHAHQCWSFKEGWTVWANWPLAALRFIDCADYDLNRQLLDVDVPVVIYANRYEEIVSADRDNWWMQTAATTSWNKKPTVTFSEVINTVITHKIPLVLDTQHFIELQQDKWGVENLEITSRDIMQSLEKFWKEAGHLVRKIHFNDFDPKKGHNLGRNLYPGTGIFPVQEFADFLKGKHWEGSVEFEVQPQHLGFGKRLGELCRFGRKLFG